VQYIPAPRPPLIVWASSTSTRSGFVVLCQLLSKEQKIEITNLSMSIRKIRPHVLNEVRLFLVPVSGVRYPHQNFECRVRS